MVVNSRHRKRHRGIRALLMFQTQAAVICRRLSGGRDETGIVDGKGHIGGGVFIACTPYRDRRLGTTLYGVRSGRMAPEIGARTSSGFCRVVAFAIFSASSLSLSGRRP